MIAGYWPVSVRYSCHIYFQFSQVSVKCYADLLFSIGYLTDANFQRHLSKFLQWRPIVLPDNYIEHASPTEQLALAGLTGHHIAATALSLLGRTREALQLVC